MNVHVTVIESPLVSATAANVLCESNPPSLTVVELNRQDSVMEATVPLVKVFANTIFVGLADPVPLYHVLVVAVALARAASAKQVGVPAF